MNEQRYAALSRAAATSAVNTEGHTTDAAPHVRGYLAGAAEAEARIAALEAAIRAHDEIDREIEIADRTGDRARLERAAPLYESSWAAVVALLPERAALRPESAATEGATDA